MFSIVMYPNKLNTIHNIVSTLMCKTKMAVDAAQPSTSSRRTRSTRPSRASTRTGSSASAPSSAIPSSSSAGASSSSRTSLSSLRESLPEKPIIYVFSELCAATNNFLANRHSSSSTPSWRCTLRNKDVLVFQRKFRRKLETDQLRQTLAVICRSNHAGLTKLLGVSISGEHIFLAYEYVDGANLADCLRNPRNPEFTVLSRWVSRMRIATDLASALDYIHNCTGLSVSFVHNHIRSNSIIVTEPDFNAKLCHFGTALLCGEIEEEKAANPVPEIVEESPNRSNDQERQFEGVRGYMSPEFRQNGVPTQKSDVYAFGVVILELLSGKEPVKYAFDKSRKEFTRSSVVEAARAAAEGGQLGMRKWIDRRMNDSFPVEVAEKVVGMALECVDEDPEKRPEMGRVAGKISKLYMESMRWSETMKVPTEISVSLAPR